MLATGSLLVIAGKAFSPALAGLALSYALQMGQLFQFATRLVSETEAIFTSVERISVGSRAHACTPSYPLRARRPARPPPASSPRRPLCRCFTWDCIPLALSPLPPLRVCVCT